MGGRWLFDRGIWEGVKKVVKEGNQIACNRTRHSDRKIDSSKTRPLCRCRSTPVSNVFPFRIWSPLGVGFHTCTAPVDSVRCCARLVTHGRGFGSEGIGPLGFFLLLGELIERKEDEAIVAPLSITRSPAVGWQTGEKAGWCGFEFQCLHCLACQAAPGTPEGKGRRIRGNRRQIIWRALDR